MALRLAEVEPRDYEYLITPTGNELPVMLEHWKRLAELLGKPLTVRTMGMSLNRAIREQKMIPNHAARWCTRILKIEVAEQYFCANAPCTSYVGLRADEDEQKRVGMYGEIVGLTKRYPLREWGWGLKEVLSYLESRCVSIPARTDCALCFYQKIGEWWNLANVKGEYMTTVIDRILMADCKPSELRRRSVAISNALFIAAESGINAAHEHLCLVMREAESGEFTIKRAPNGDVLENSNS